MKKIKIKDDLESQKAKAYLEGFLEGRDRTAYELVRMNKEGMKPREIMKFLKDYVKAHENNNQQN